MEIIEYSEQYFEKLIAFLRKNWSPNHSLYDKQLFDWQYKGVYENNALGYLLVEKGDVKGFVGGVPYPFLIDEKEVSGAGLAFWVIDPLTRSSGTGKLLRKALEEKVELIYNIGLNLVTAKSYIKAGYAYYDEFHRYVVPLNVEGYCRLLVNECSFEKINEWVDHLPKGKEIIPCENIDVDKVAKLYEKNVKPAFRLLPYKDSRFWKWRYVDSKGFPYMFFEHADNVIIARVESVHDKTDLQKHGLKCFRIIEILPSTGNVWNGSSDAGLTETILGILAWAKLNDCVLADFQISNSRLEHVITSTGFRRQDNTEETSVIRLFAPLRNVNPLNFAYRINAGGDTVSIDREDTYLVKSDSDMDRPNWLG